MEAVRGAVVLESQEDKALLAVVDEMDRRFRIALVLAHETGHRIGAIRKVQWSDVDLGQGLIRRRAESEKTGLSTTRPWPG